MKEVQQKQGESAILDASDVRASVEERMKRLVVPFWRRVAAQRGLRGKQVRIKS